MSDGRIRWEPVVTEAARIAREVRAALGTPPTLRQLHYRLVSLPALGYPNTPPAYKRLSALTAEARRAGTFPALADNTRRIHRATTWTGPADGLRTLAGWYRRDRTAGQDALVVLGVEKDTLSTQVRTWFGDPYGLPLVVLRGYGSQTYADQVARMARLDRRPAVLLYAGDHDPSGDDIVRDFTERTGCWSEVVRVTVTADQVESLGLPVAPGKPTDSRAGRFIAEHGELRQVETEAVPPDVLRDLFADALADYWDRTAYEDVLAREEGERRALEDLADDWA